MPGWVVAALFLAVWLSAWAAGEVTVAKEVIDALADGGLDSMIRKTNAPSVCSTFSFFCHVCFTPRGLLGAVGFFEY